MFVFFNDTATTEIYTLSLHDALPILGLLQAGFDLGNHAYSHPSLNRIPLWQFQDDVVRGDVILRELLAAQGRRSEEHTSELQSRQYLACRLLLETKKHPHLQSRLPNY